MWRKAFKQQIWKYVEEVSWAQWNRFGLLGTGAGNTYSSDLECSLLLAAYTGRQQERLWDGIFTWLQEYRELVNRERLANLLKQFQDPWLFQSMGALFEKLDPTYWKRIVLLCRQHFTPGANLAEPLLEGISVTKWVQEDPVFKKWAILKAKSTPRKKLQPSSQIMAKNALFRYRLLMTSTARADVLYLLSISHHLKSKKETDLVTNDHCVQILGYDSSSIHRIQKDFEKAKFLQPFSHTAKQRSIKTTPWKIQEEGFLLPSETLENGIVNWYRVTQLFIKLFHLSQQPGFDSSDLVAKSHLHEHLMHWLQFLENYECPLPDFPRKDKLEKIKASNLGFWVVKILRAFSKWIAG